MRGSTHLAAGLLLATLVPDATVAQASGLVVGSLLPDIDDEHSFIGRYVPIIPKLLGHRRFSHSLLFAAIFWCVSPAVALGVLTHFALDFPNPDGIPLLWPLFPRKMKIPFISALMPSGGFVDKMLGFVLWGLVFVKALGALTGVPII